MGEREGRMLGLVMAVAGAGWLLANYWRELMITWAIVTLLLWIFAFRVHGKRILHQIKQQLYIGTVYLVGIGILELFLIGLFAIAVYFSHWSQINGIKALWSVPYALWHNPSGGMVTLLGFLVYLVPILVAGAFIYVAPFYVTWLGYQLLCQEVDNRQEEDRLIRGRRIMPMEEAVQALPDANAISFGFMPVKPDELKSHGFIVGATGSGKTIAVKSFLGTTLSEIRENGSGKRALIYDAKTEFVPLVELYVPSEKLFILNPFDMRSAAWDMAKDITAPAQAQTVAEILVPKNPRASQPFFEEATRTLLTGVMIAFMKNAGTDWTFRDVLQGLSTKRKLKEVLRSCDQTRDLWERFFSNDQTGDNVLTSIAASIAPFEFVAAAWERAERRISLKEFVETEAVIVLGNDEEQRSALDRVNQLIFRRLSELLLAQEDSSERTTYLVIDEVREAGKLEGLHSLLVRGRSKGVSVVLTFQEIEGLRQVYGDKVAHEITGQCGNKVFLRLGSPQTAEWASSFFGEQEWIEIRRSASEGESSGATSAGFGGRDTTQAGQSSGSTWTETRVVKKAIQPAEFLDIPKAGPGSGFYGYADFHSVGAFQIAYQWDDIAELLPPAGRVAALERRPAEHQYLTQWGRTDRARLKLGVDQVIPVEVEPAQPQPQQAPQAESVLGLKDMKR